MSCTPTNIVVDGITISTSDFENARELLETVSGDQGDPTQDAYDENIANGNNNRNSTGVQFPAPTQTTLPEPITLPPDQKSEKPAPGGNGSPTGCAIWGGSYNEQLSTNFQLKDFTIAATFPNQLTAFPPLSAQDRFCNLQNLAINVAEPLLARFGPFRINSGIRNQNSTSSGLSQHVTGQAMDVQFNGWSYSRYWENAAWIRDNIQYDQFIFEHSDKTGLAWYHLSFNKDGNRAASISTKVMTMYRNKYSPGLLRFG